MRSVVPFPVIHTFDYLIDDIKKPIVDLVTWENTDTARTMRIVSRRFRDYVDIWMDLRSDYSWLLWLGKKAHRADSKLLSRLLQNKSVYKMMSSTSRTISKPLGYRIGFVGAVGATHHLIGLDYAMANSFLGVIDTNRVKNIRIYTGFHNICGIKSQTWYEQIFKAMCQGFNGCCMHGWHAMVQALLRLDLKLGAIDSSRGILNCLKHNHWRTLRVLLDDDGFERLVISPETIILCAERGYFESLQVLANDERIDLSVNNNLILKTTQIGVDTLRNGYNMAPSSEWDAYSDFMTNEGVKERICAQKKETYTRARSCLDLIRSNPKVRECVRKSKLKRWREE